MAYWMAYKITLLCDKYIFTKITFSTKVKLVSSHIKLYTVYFVNNKVITPRNKNQPELKQILSWNA